MKAPIAYYGGKSGMARAIAELLPPHRVYMEPFFGSGAVFFAKQPSVHEILNDVDGAVVTFFRMMRDHREELEAACFLSPHARDEFAAADLNEPGLNELEVARRFWVRVNQSFAKTCNDTTGWSITTARTQSVPGSCISRLGRFEACARRLLSATFENCDAIDLILRLTTADTVIYVDPPYLGDARNSRTGGGKGDYRFDMQGEDDHRRLAKALHESPATFILSGYPSDLYEELYRDCWRADFAVTARSSNMRRSTRSGRTECLWSNRDLLDGRLALEHV